MSFLFTLVRSIRVLLMRDTHSQWMIWIVFAVCSYYYCYYYSKATSGATSLPVNYDLDNWIFRHNIISWNWFYKRHVPVQAETNIICHSNRWRTVIIFSVFYHGFNCLRPILIWFQFYRWVSERVSVCVCVCETIIRIMGYKIYRKQAAEKYEMVPFKTVYRSIGLHSNNNWYSNLWIKIWQLVFLCFTPRFAARCFPSQRLFFAVVINFHKLPGIWPIKNLSESQLVLHSALGLISNCKLMYIILIRAQ